MIRLNDEEMLSVNGGAIGKAAVALIGAVVVFVIGLIDGIINPRKCN